jgi:signal transduction histidine kinase
MNLFNMFLLTFSAIFNLWFYFKTPSTIDFTLVKNTAFLSREKLSFSQHRYTDFANGLKPSISIVSKQFSGASLSKKDQHRRHSYLIFTVATALVSIGLEFFLAKKARTVKQRNQLLRLSNEVMAKQNAELQQALVEMEESTTTNSRMFQVIAHDLRSPMAAIVGLSGFMIDEHHLSQEDMEVVSLIHTSAVDSLKFINEILDQETAKMEMKKEAVDLHLLLTYCIAQLKYKAHEKSQEIKLESTTTVKLRLNREKIWRVVINLISNALKFSPHKSTVTIALNLADEKAIISVEDRGIGIPEHLSDQIFGVSAARKREGTAGEKSFGMGLSIAKQNIEAHGGTLSFVSGAGKGTTFFIELPL